MTTIGRPLRRLATTAALTVLAVPVCAVLAPQTPASSAESGVIRIAGELPAPPGQPKHPQRASSVVAVDAARRLLYLTYTDTNLVSRIVTYDLRSRVPRPVASGVLGAEGDFTLATRYTVAFDTRRSNLAFITPIVDVDGNSVPTGTVTVAIYNDAKRSVVSKWNLAQRVPGFYPLGITYSEKDDRYYAVGEFSAHRNLGDGTFTPGKMAGPGTSVVALDAATGDAMWVRPVPECQQVLYSKDVGSLVARSTDRDALYLACVSGGAANGMTYPGQTGLVRLSIDPKADNARANQLPVEFFAVSGSYFAGGQASGIAAFDARTERFYLQSIAYTTPGAWVFDGRLTAWVGFVAAPTNSNFFIGINEGMGHLYAGLRRGSSRSARDGLLVANVRQTPVPAGDFVSSVVPSSLVATDPLSNRLFVRPFNPNDPILVVEDLTEVTSRNEPVEYDAGTSDVPDTPAADVFYGLGATGYAAQSVQVGGTGAPRTGLGPGAPQPPTVPGVPTVAGGTRALMTARVGALDLRPNGASANAQSALPDVNTVKEYETNGPDTDGDGKPDPWPFPVGNCLDAGGRPVSQAWRDDRGTAATYAVQCDLAKNVAKSVVTMGASGTGAATVQRGYYAATATRDTTDGAVVATNAIADGALFETTGGYSVRLGRVQATTRTRAHGRPGTTHAVWTRDVDGLRVVDSGGATLLHAPGCASRVEVRAGRVLAEEDTCRALGDAVNQLLRTRFKMAFPMPFVAATPKGAFAGVEQTEGEYFQQVVVNDQGVVYRGDSVGIRPTPAVVTETYNDTTERSRTVTVLAATQSNAVFQVNERVGAGGPGDRGETGGPGSGPGVGGSGETDGGNAPGPRPGGRTGEQSDGGATLPPQSVGATGSPGLVETLRGFLFMRRSARDITLLVLLAGLLLGGAGTAWRRRRLVEVLVTVPRKEAAL